MKALVIFNPHAGPYERGEEVQALAQYLSSVGWEVIGVEVTHGAGDATSLARRAADANCDVVFAAGGDGTLSQVVEGLIGTETALGVVPSGTGNVMGRQLGLPIPGGLWPTTMVESARLLLQGEVRPVDLSRVTLNDGQHVCYSLCWVGVGFDAQVNLAVHEEPERKHRLGVLAYAVAGFSTFGKYAGTAARLHIDDRPINSRIIMAVANNIQLYGGWLRMAPGALLDDGLLDVYVFRGRTPVKTALHAVRLLFGQHLQASGVDSYQARHLHIRTTKPLPVHVDGEPAGYTPVAIDVVPSAVRLLVPPTAPPGLFVHQAASFESAP